MRRLTLLLTTLLLITISSCNKVYDFDDREVDTKNIKNNEYPDDFQWSNMKSVTIEIAGLPGLPEIRKTLTIESPDGMVYLKKLVNISGELRETIRVPDNVNEVVVRCGNLRISSPIVEGMVICSLNTGNSDD